MTMTMTMTQSYWDLLPTELRSKVYEYDGTYKEIMNKKIFGEMWKSSWLLHKDNIFCPYKKIVMEYLLSTWGIYDHKLQENNWYKKNYFPHDFIYITDFYDQEFNNNDCKKVNVTIYRDNNCLFDGWVLNEKAQREKNWEYNRNTYDAIDVFWDTHFGLYVWRKLYW